KYLVFLFKNNYLNLLWISNLFLLNDRVQLEGEKTKKASFCKRTERRFLFRLCSLICQSIRFAGVGTFNQINSAGCRDFIGPVPPSLKIRFIEIVLYYCFL